MFQKKINIIIVVVSFVLGNNLNAQKTENNHSLEGEMLVENDTTIDRVQVFDAINIPRDFSYQYRTNLSRVKKVYPLALRAAELVDSLDYVMGNMSRKTKQKKAARQTTKQLKEEFKFLIKDMYVSEGKVLTKLIYRETGMTVKEIIKKYKNGFEASFYDTMGKMFEQELDAVYDPDGEDFVLETIIQDILAEQVSFDPMIKTITKQEYKEIQKESKAKRKKSKKLFKQRKKEEKKKAKKQAL